MTIMLDASEYERRFGGSEEKHGAWMDPAEYSRWCGAYGSEEKHGMTMSPEEYKRRGYTESGLAG